MSTERRAAELHPEAQTVVDLLASAEVPPVRALSPDGARERMRRLFVSPDEPEPVGAIDEYLIPGPDGEIPIRAYSPDADGPRPVLVWYHGGGFVLGGLETTDPACRALANACDALVLSVDYRLAPEHPWPAGVLDCYAAAAWAARYADEVGGDPDRVAVGGSSAGGNLAAVVALMARDRRAGGDAGHPFGDPGPGDPPELAHQLLVYPTTHNDDRGPMPSYQENGEGYLLERADSAWFHDQYFARDIDAYHPYAFPLQAPELDGLPPATVLTAGFDPLRDEGFAYADRLEAAGVDVVHRNYDDTIHGFFSMLGANELAHARAAVEDAAADFRRFV